MMGGKSKCDLMLGSEYRSQYMPQSPPYAPSPRLLIVPSYLALTAQYSADITRLWRCYLQFFISLNRESTAL